MIWESYTIMEYVFNSRAHQIFTEYFLGNWCVFFIVFFGGALFVGFCILMLGIDFLEEKKKSQF